jgi:LPXTG-motif cell wall-anchored protein
MRNRMRSGVVAIGAAIMAFALLFGATAAAAAALGAEWNSATVDASQSSLNFKTVAYGSGHWVAVQSSGQTALSTDGKSWIVGGATGISTNRAITFGGGRFVVVGDHDSAVSTDNGLTWVTGTASSDYYYDVAFGNGTFVKAEDDNCPGILSWSTDGLAWTDVNASSGCWSAVTFGNGKFVAIGGRKITVSTDNGATWNDQTFSAPNGSFGGIAFGGGQFTVFANSHTLTDNQLFTSPDALTWTARSNLGGVTSAAWTSISYGGGSWLLSSGSTSFGTLVTAVSSDGGATWLGQLVDGYEWNDSAFGNDTFVTVGRFAGGTPPAGRTASPIAWSAASAPTPSPAPLPNTGPTGQEFTGATTAALLVVGGLFMLLRRRRVR